MLSPHEKTARAGVPSGFQIQRAPVAENAPTKYHSGVAHTSPGRFADQHAAACRRENAWARRQRRAGHRSKRGIPFMIANIRVCELERIYRDRSGDVLTDDDAGRGDLRLALDHLALASDEPYGRMLKFAASWAPWLDGDELEDIIDEVFYSQRRWTASRLGVELRLTSDERLNLRITTIRSAVASTRPRMLAERAKRKAAAKRSKRRSRTDYRHDVSQGSAKALQPWVALGWSRSKFYMLPKAERERILADLRLGLGCLDSVRPHQSFSSIGPSERADMPKEARPRHSAPTHAEPAEQPVKAIRASRFARLLSMPASASVGAAPGSIFDPGYGLASPTVSACFRIITPTARSERMRISGRFPLPADLWRQPQWPEPPPWGHVSLTLAEVRP